MHISVADMVHSQKRLLETIRELQNSLATANKEIDRLTNNTNGISDMDRYRWLKKNRGFSDNSIDEMILSENKHGI